MKIHRILSAASLPIIVLLAQLAGCGKDDDQASKFKPINQCDPDGSGTASGGSGGGSGGLVINDDGGVLNIPDDAGCVDTTSKGEITPLDMLFAVDISYSTDFALFNSKWSNIKSALKRFAGTPEFNGLGVGLQYFPIFQQCSPPEYQKLAVDYGVLPAVTPAINASLDSRAPLGGTPMAPALEGAIAAAAQRLQGDPRRKGIVVLATDGLPDDNCSNYPNTLKKVADIARAGAARTPPVRTFVIAVGTNLTALDTVAAAGGTQKALVVNTALNVETQLIDAFRAIRKASIDCEYTLPDAPPGKTLTYNQVNVRIQLRANSKPEFLSFVPTAAACGATRSWYYDKALADRPTKVILCPTVCGEAQQEENPNVSVILGCSQLTR